MRLRMRDLPPPRELRGTGHPPKSDAPLSDLKSPSTAHGYRLGSWQLLCRVALHVAGN